MRDPNNPADASFLRTTSYFDALLRPRETRTKRMIDNGGGTSAMQTIVSGRVDYDKGGRVKKRYEPYLSSGTPDPNAATTFDYVLNGNAANAPDPLGRAYRVTSPSGTQQRMTYNGASRSTFNETNVETRVSLDPFERVLSEEVITTGPGAYSTRTYVYDGAGRVISEKQNATAATEITHTYDRLGRKTQTVDPDSGTWRYLYDKGGNLIAQDDPKPNQHVEFCYDALNRVTLACPLPADYGGTNTYNCAWSIQCNSQEIKYRYDAALPGDPGVPNAVGHLVHVTDGSGTTYFKGWDDRGRLLQVTKRIKVDGIESAGTTTFSYDNADRVIGTLYPDGEWVLTQYDASGQPVAVRGNNGSFPYVDNVVYDLFGRAKVVEHSNGVDDQRTYHAAPGQAQHQRLATLQTVKGGTKHLDLSYSTYNARGQLLGIVDLRDVVPSALSNRATYAYDELGRLMTVSNNALIDGDYVHNNFGNITQKETRHYTYPAAKPHQMSEMRIGSPSGTPTPVAHDANGSRIDPYATPTPNQTANHRYQYDEWNRLETIKVTNSAGTVLHTISFTYDYTGRRVSKKVGSTVTRYYSDLTETTGTYQYKTYALGGVRVASQRTTYLGWEVASIEQGAVRFAAVDPGHVAVVLLVRRDVQLGVALTLSLLAVGLTIAPWKRKRVAGIVLRHGHVIGVVIAFTIATLPIPLIVAPAYAGCGDPPPTPTPPPGGNVSHFHTDHLGSTQVETDQAGNILEQIRYKPYGEVRGRWTAAGVLISSPSPDYRYEFTGYETELKSGLNYAGARFYDSSAGMFLSHDPKRQFASPYAYGPWDPINGTDPSGEFFIVLAGSLIAASVIATTIDTYVKTGDVGTALKAGAFAQVASSVPPGSSYGLQLVAPTAFGKPNPGEYAIGLIPVVGSAHSAARNFENGNYASGTVAAVQTVIQLVAIAYGAYQRVSQPAQVTANGTVYSAGDAPISSGGCGCGDGGEPLVKGVIYLDDAVRTRADGIQPVSLLNDPVFNAILLGVAVAGVFITNTVGTATVGAAIRTTPRNLAEKLLLDEAKGGAGERIMQGKILDPKFPEAAWAKIQHSHTNPGGWKTVIHYWENLQTGMREGFKFK